jgi:hypothetical protein
MNAPQQLWWEQTLSDHSILRILRRAGVSPCHQLHYLQMVTEKLGKAYFWRKGTPPPKSHASFVRFMQALDDRSSNDRERIAKFLGFGKAQSMQDWIPKVTPLAYELERLAPSLAGDNGPNPEYPWPRKSPTTAPVLYAFAVWQTLTETTRGHQFLKVIDAAVMMFPEYC